MEVVIDKRGYSLITLASALLAYTILTNKYNSLYNLSTILYVFILFSYIMVRLEENVVMRSLNLKRSITTLEDEKESEIYIELKNESIYPLFLSVADNPPKRFRIVTKPSWKAILGPKSRMVLSYKVIPSPGRSFFGSIDICAEDPFALFRSCVSLNNIKTYEAKVPPSPKYKIAIRKVLPTTLGVLPIQRRRGKGTTFLYIREYTEGDDLRYVDWKAYARLGKLLVKVFEEESLSSVNIILVLDKSLSILRPLDAFSSALRLAASLINEFLKTGLRINFFIFEKERLLGPYKFQSSKGYNEVLMKKLSSLEPPSSTIDIDALRKAFLRIWETNRSLIYLIGSVEEIFNFLESLNVKISLFYIMPQLYRLEGDVKDLLNKLQYKSQNIKKLGHNIYLVIKDDIIEI